MDRLFYFSDRENYSRRKSKQQSSGIYTIDGAATSKDLIPHRTMSRGTTGGDETKTLLGKNKQLTNVWMCRPLVFNILFFDSVHFITFFAYL